DPRRRDHHRGGSARSAPARARLTLRSDVAAANVVRVDSPRSVANLVLAATVSAMFATGCNSSVACAPIGALLVCRCASGATGTAECLSSGLGVCDCSGDASVGDAGPTDATFDAPRDAVASDAADAAGPDDGGDGSVVAPFPTTW